MSTIWLFVSPFARAHENVSLMWDQADNGRDGRNRSCFAAQASGSPGALTDVRNL